MVARARLDAIRPATAGPERQIRIYGWCHERSVQETQTATAPTQSHATCTISSEHPCARQADGAEGTRAYEEDACHSRWPQPDHGRAQGLAKHVA